MMRGPGRPASPARGNIVQRLRVLEPGASFFVEGATQSSVGHLRRIAAAENIDIEIHTVVEDEIYLKPGVRIFRKRLDT